MIALIHRYMCNHDFHGVFHSGCEFYPWATWQGTTVTLACVLLLSAIVSWFIFYVIKPEPGCIFEGKVPLLPLYVGDPRGYRDPRYRCPARATK